MHFTQYAPEEIPDIPNPSDRVLGGSPGLEFMDILGWYGRATNGAHTGTGMVAPLDGKSAFELHTLLRTAIETKFGLDYLAYPLLINARSYIHVFGCIFDADDEAALASRVRGLPGLITEAAKAGYGEYRSHLDNMDLTQDTYSFGDHAYRRFVERIKDAVDPNGILAPGQAGHLARVLPRQQRLTNRRSDFVPIQFGIFDHVEAKGDKPVEEIYEERIASLEAGRGGWLPRVPPRRAPRPPLVDGTDGVGLPRGRRA